MSKNCAWCGDVIHEADNSHEDREFKPFGKLCLYFCSDVCQKEYMADKEAHQGLGVYYIGVRA